MAEKKQSKLPAEIEGIREVVARMLYFDFEDFEKGTVAEMTWREAPQIRKDIWLNKADQLLSELSKHGVVVLDKKQIIPKIEFKEIENTVISLSTEDFAKVLTILDEWHKRFYGAGFRRVVNLDGTPVKEVNDGNTRRCSS